MVKYPKEAVLISIRLDGRISRRWHRDDPGHTRSLRYHMTNFYSLGSRIEVHSEIFSGQPVLPQFRSEHLLKFGLQFRQLRRPAGRGG